MLSVKLARAKISAQLALTHKLFQLMEFVTTAPILVIPAELLLPSVLHVSRDSTLLDLPVLLPAQLELTPSMESVNVFLDLFSPTNVLLHAQLDSELLEDNALNALITVLAAQDHHLLVLHALMDMPLTLLPVSARLLLHANSVNTSLSLTANAQESALKTLSTMNLFVLLLVFKDIKITELEDALPRTSKVDAHSPTTLAMEFA
jgi:hypothetical protein